MQKTIYFVRLTSSQGEQTNWLPYELDGNLAVYFVYGRKNQTTSVIDWFDEAVNLPRYLEKNHPEIEYETEIRFVELPE